MYFRYNRVYVATEFVIIELQCQVLITVLSSVVLDKSDHQDRKKYFFCCFRHIFGSEVQVALAIRGFSIRGLKKSTKTANN